MITFCKELGSENLQTQVTCILLHLMHCYAVSISCNFYFSPIATQLEWNIWAKTFPDKLQKPLQREEFGFSFRNVATNFLNIARCNVWTFVALGKDVFPWRHGTVENKDVKLSSVAALQMTNKRRKIKVVIKYNWQYESYILSYETVVVLTSKKNPTTKNLIHKTANRILHCL